jgi:hypothetical protein
MLKKRSRKTLQEESELLGTSEAGTLPALTGTVPGSVFKSANPYRTFFEFSRILMTAQHRFLCPRRPTCCRTHMHTHTQRLLICLAVLQPVAASGCFFFSSTSQHYS